MVNKTFEFSNSVGLNKNIIIDKPHLGGSFWGKLFNLGVKYIPKIAEKGLPFLKKAAIPFLEKGVEKALGAVGSLFGKSRQKIQNVLPEALKPLGKQMMDSAEEQMNEQIRQRLSQGQELFDKYTDFKSYSKRGDGFSKKQALDSVGDVINKSRQKIEDVLPSALNIADEQIRQKMRLGEEAFNRYKGDGFVSDFFKKGTQKLQDSLIEKQINPLKDRYINAGKDEVNKQIRQKLGFVGDQFDKIRDFQIGYGLSRKSLARQKIKKLLM